MWMVPSVEIIYKPKQEYSNQQHLHCKYVPLITDIFTGHRLTNISENVLKNDEKVIFEIKVKVLFTN